MEVLIGEMFSLSESSGLREHFFFGLSQDFSTSRDDKLRTSKNGCGLIRSIFFFSLVKSGGGPSYKYILESYDPR